MNETAMDEVTMDKPTMGDTNVYKSAMGEITMN